MTDKFLKHYYNHNMRFFQQFFTEWENCNNESKAYGFDVGEYQTIELKKCKARNTIIFDHHDGGWKLIDDKEDLPQDLEEDDILIEKDDIVDVFFDGSDEKEMTMSFNSCSGHLSNVKDILQRSKKTLKTEHPIQFLDSYQCEQQSGFPMPYYMI